LFLFNLWFIHFVGKRKKSQSHRVTEYKEEWSYKVPFLHSIIPASLHSKFLHYFIGISLIPDGISGQGYLQVLVGYFPGQDYMSGVKHLRPVLYHLNNIPSIFH
jgi:hypothetical protein